MDNETFWALLHSPGHWWFELFLMALFDGILGLLIWPFIKRHWDHHKERDLQDLTALYGFKRQSGSALIFWKSIETAPLDERDILLGFFDTARPFMAVGRFRKNRNEWECEVDGMTWHGFRPATHWMELPRAP